MSRLKRRARRLGFLLETCVTHDIVSCCIMLLYAIKLLSVISCYMMSDHVSNYVILNIVWCDLILYQIISYSSLKNSVLALSCWLGFPLSLSPVDSPVQLKKSSKNAGGREPQKSVSAFPCTWQELWTCRV